MSETECGIKLNQIVFPGSHDRIFDCPAIRLGTAMSVYGIKYSHEVGLPFEEQTKAVTYIVPGYCDILIEQDKCMALYV